MILPFDRDVEKPLLPLTNSSTPNHSRPSSPPSLIYQTHPSFAFWRGILSGRRRLVLLGLIASWFLLLGAYFRPPFDGGRFRHVEGTRHGRIDWGQVWAWGGGGREGDGTRGKGVFAKRPPLGATPLTELGTEADKVYSIGETDPELYQRGLEDFIRFHFPPADSNERDPDSLINAMRTYFPSSSSSQPDYPPIPNKLWQTAGTLEYYDVKASSRDSFKYHNADINITFHDDAAADAWVRDRFALEGDETAGSPLGVVKAWEKLDHPKVLRSDLWRYLVLATDGGIYADTDIECRHNLRDWGPDISWGNINPADYKPPSLIVGIEADVMDRHDWHLWWPRPLQLSQWTMASARGHPVMIDVIRRVVEMALAPEPSGAEDGAGRRPKSVMERTGPGPFTDAVLAYLYVKWDKTWADLRKLTPDGWRSREVDRWKKNKSIWGDMKVLSITGFSPGVGHMGSGEPNSPAAMVLHQFAGSWREQEGADAR